MNPLNEIVIRKWRSYRGEKGGGEKKKTKEEKISFVREVRRRRRKKIKGKRKKKNHSKVSIGKSEVPKANLALSSKPRLMSKRIQQRNVLDTG